MHLHIGHPFFGSGNLGDDLVLAGFLEGLSRHPDIRISCATAYDVAAQRRRFRRIEWVPGDNATRTRLIGECDAWIGLGGSLLQASDDGWLLADQVAQLEACARAGKPAFFISCSVDHRTDAARPEIAYLLSHAEWIWTRDETSTAALRAMGFSRATTAADLSHLALAAMRPAPVEAGVTGLVCNFERPADISIPQLARLIATVPGAPRARWLVQEVRSLPGSELDLFERLPDDVRRTLDLRRPDYGCATSGGLIAPWGSPEFVFSTRYHAAVVGAWSRSRVVVFERQQKLRGVATCFGLPSFDTMPDPDQLANAFERSIPVARAALEQAAALAAQACDALVKAVTSARAEVSGPRTTNIQTQREAVMSSPPRIERLSLQGTDIVTPDRMGPGLKHGEIFVVRGCLQAIDALGPLRGMILDTIAEVSGPDARRRVETDGLVRLHEHVSIDDLTRMNPLMKERARRLAAPIIARLADLLPGLGPDVHFEDTPNVRIFVPEQVSASHREALASYAERRGSGGELTLHPPHQDSRHFHPIGAINVWCAIGEVSEENSMSVFPTFYGHHLPYDEKDGGIRPDQYLGPLVATALAPGDAWIFETVQLHGSTINQTDQTRVVISFRVTTEAPRYRDKRWYNYVRPADCGADGPPANTVDYSQARPDRGRVTLNTSDRFPAAAATSRSAKGELAIAGDLVREGVITPLSERVCAARIGGKAVAFGRKCPHSGYDLAGGSIHNGKIVCAWHGLRIDPSTGASACGTIPHLPLVASREDAGILLVDDRGAAERLPPITAQDHYAGAIAQLQRTANRFHERLSAWREANGEWGLEDVAAARTAAAYALLGVPGDVVRDQLAATVSQLVEAVLRSGVRRTIRTVEEETTFVECWRRLGESWTDDAVFTYGLAALMLSTHGFELLALKPLGQRLGWTEPLWLTCLAEVLPAGVALTDVVAVDEPLPPAIAEAQSRIAAMTPAARDELMRTVDQASAGAATAGGSRGAPDAVKSLQRQLETTVLHLQQASADRELLRGHIEVLRNSRVLRMANKVGRVLKPMRRG